MSPTEAAAGSETTLTFQVPNEKEDANTTKIAGVVPAGPPDRRRVGRAVAGWKVDVATTQLKTPITTDEGESLTEGVSTITWTATDGTGIPAGCFEQFKVAAGLPDDVTTLEFPTLQTYSDGDVVKWIDPVTEGGPEAEFPEPDGHAHRGRRRRSPRHVDHDGHRRRVTPRVAR